VAAAAGASASSSHPRSGGTLRAAIVGDLPSIDGQQMLPGINATVGNAYETLTRYGDNLTSSPSWPFAARTVLAGFGRGKRMMKSK
jgi:hypothetical protein